MVPTERSTAEQFSSFLTQLKAPPSAEDPMRPEQWSSPTSITTNPTDATTSTSQALPSFTLDQQGSHYYPTDSMASRLPATASLATPTGYYTNRETVTTSAQWSSAPIYSSGAPMLPTDFQQPPQHPALHPLVMQPMPRGNEDDLAMDAQMLREVLQELPQGQTPVAQPRGQQVPGLQLLFAAPMHPDMAAPAPQTSAPGYFGSVLMSNAAPADMLLTMSQSPSPLSAAPVAPIYPSVQDATQPRTSMAAAMPLTAGLAGAYDPNAVAGAMLPPPILPRKKRTTATRICKVEGCTKGIRSRGLCKAHGGGRRCTTPGCTTSDQGGGHCVLHGGGRRCRIEGCKKSAQWRGVCKMHGGARRCRYGQCTKNGQVKQGYCRMHHNLLTAQRQQQEQLQQQQQQMQAPVPQLPAMGAVAAPAVPVKFATDAI